ncbi:methyltransferase domain-containing protein [bacterium]|nr:methyltransferase domain-containing protein [bacterium]
MAGPTPIISEPVELYLARLAVTDCGVPPVIEELHAEASRRCFPIVGPEVGRFFRQLALLRHPRRILELGSGFGYSALWWALGAPQAEIHLTDWNQNLLDEAMRHAAALGVAHQLRTHQGDALVIAEDLPGPWDIVFADLNKEQYPEVIDLARRALAVGGVLVFDNILWHGEVAAPAAEQPPPARAVVEATRRLYNDPDFACSILPIRDGVLLAVRTGVSP